MTEVLNSPLELAIRLVILLDEVDAKSWSLDELLVLDHLAVHSSDFDGPESLHPAFPLRSADVGARRSTLRQALELLAHKGLVDIKFDQGGIAFEASDTAHSVAVLLESQYAAGLRDRAQWLRSSQLVEDSAAIESRLREIIESWPEDAIQ